MLTNSSLIRAGASGGGMGDKPRWVRILLITGGSLIEAMIFIFPLQWMHFDISISKTLAKSLAQELFLIGVFSSEYSFFSSFSFVLI